MNVDHSILTIKESETEVVQMLFLDHTQIQYCKVKNRDKTILGLIYNNNLFIKEKGFAKEEIEIAIKECREEYLDHEERSQIPTLLIKERDSISIWMQNNDYKSNIISDSNGSKHSKTPTSSGTNKSKSNLNRISLRQLAQEMHSEQGVEIKTRRHRLKLYQSCFLGSEAVDWIAAKTKLSKEDALTIGQKMIDKGLFHHVLDEHKFKDEALFYRFIADEGKSIWNSSI
ncbi:MAG: hypothetical protein AAFQ80_08625 [Cyanobacteria bacterium J06621_8]